MQNEFKRIKKELPLIKVDLSRYAISTQPAKEIKDLDSFVDKTKILMQHANFRSLNLELMQKFSPDLYKLQLKQLEAERDR